MKSIPFASDEEQTRGAATAAAHLRAGGLIAYPTETVYGFGSALAPEPLERLARLKRRDRTKPFLLLVPAWPPEGVVWTPLAARLADAFWPGPLTLVLEADANAFPAAVAAEGTVAMRCSPHPGVARLLEALGAPITSTSANAPGEPAARTAADVRRTLERAGVQDVLVLDAGPLPPSPSSTVVDVSVGSARVLREGATETGALRRVLGGTDAA